MPVAKSVANRSSDEHYMGVQVAKFVSALIAALLLLPVGLALPSAAATSAAALTITGPAQVEPGDYPDFTVRGDATGGADTIEIVVSGPTFYRQELQDVEEGPFRFTYSPGRLDDRGTYQLTVRSIRTGRTATSELIVDDLPPEFRVLRLDRSSFYPLITDGYQDTVTLNYATTQRAVVSAEVYSPQGQRIQTFDRRVYDPDNQWSPARMVWGGRDRNGRLVRPGRYNIIVTATADGVEISQNRYVQVTSKRVTQRVTEFRDGINTSSRRRTSGCTITGTGYNRQLVLDCLGSDNRDTATAGYTFRLPASARNVRWGVKGSIRCCSPGYVRRSGNDVGQRRFRVAVKISYVRGFTVRKTWVSYLRTVQR